MKKLSKKELTKRASRVKLVLTDNDGVLTDTGVYYSDAGEAFKRFSIRDGMGVERLRNAGIETAIISGELSGSVQKRAEKLQMKFLYLGVKNKQEQLNKILIDTGFKIEEVAFIGDDVNDLEALEIIGKTGLTAAPLDAIADVRRSVHYIAKAKGGNGAFRDFAEWILKLKNNS